MPNMKKETLGQRIARLRKEKGFTQHELAKKAGTVQKMISDYELGKTRPNPDAIVNLSTALEVSADQLLGLKKTKKHDGAVNRSLLKRMRQIEALPHSQQKFILRAIDSHLKALSK
jgi:transcriptional regulator with XRE-family HTH domain